jgi:hypothetical protein
LGGDRGRRDAFEDLLNLFAELALEGRERGRGC